jgi:hypothetical protein
LPSVYAFIFETQPMDFLPASAGCQSSDRAGADDL